MGCDFQNYLELDYEIPGKTTAWNMYGAGTENIGRNGKPEVFDILEPGEDQMLVRVDSVGLCFSDVKLIKQGSKHSKLYGRDLSKEPTRLGHEVSFTVIKVGKNLAGKYHPRQRLAIQPDIYQNQISTAYGYTISGGLTQYHLLGPEVLDADDGAYVIPVKDQIGYAEAALTEPWACVNASYTQRRRLEPKDGGSMWIMGNPQDSQPYQFSSGLAAPKNIFLTDVPDKLKTLINKEKSEGTRVVVMNHLKPGDLAQFSQEHTDGKGFDDIILLSPSSAELVSKAVDLIAFRGTFNIVSQTTLDGEVSIDAGRLHYHYTAFIGTNSVDISASYGKARNRCDLRQGGTAVFIGAGGPMGQMHVQRAIEDENGPSLVIATEINPHRLAVLQEIINPLAKANGKQFAAYNPETAEKPLQSFITDLTGGKLADDVVVCVPVAPLMESSVKVLEPDGMLVFFAGVAIGTKIKVKLDNLFLSNLQLTGTSGSKLSDQVMIMEKTLRGELNTNRSVAAIGGIEAAREGLEALMSGKYAGKIIIFPQVSGLPLIGVDELSKEYPQIASHLGENNLWTAKAEKAMIELFWCGEKNE